MLNVLFYTLNFIVNNIIMTYCLIYDLKYRKIPNVFFKYNYFVIFILNFIDFILYFNSIFLYLIIKFIILCLMVLITFFLFCINSIGGADAKLIITLFLLIPINFFSFSLIFKYTIWFLIIQTFYISYNFTNNYIFRNKFSFDQFFIINHSISKIKHIYFSLFYRFSNYSEVNTLNDIKLLIRDTNLYFNFKSEKFQILTQSRPPLIIIVIITYYILFIV